jgi:hypothetical protein
MRHLSFRAKTALVLGLQYTGRNKLKNTVNDAKAMAALLEEKLGFSVTSTCLTGKLKIDAVKMAVHDFHTSLKNGGIGFFFFAGHGCFSSNKNWLMADIPKSDVLVDRRVQFTRALVRPRTFMIYVLMNTTLFGGPIAHATVKLLLTLFYVFACFNSSYSIDAKSVVDGMRRTD